MVTSQRTFPIRLLVVLVLAGFALAAWQARPTTGRTALQAGLLSLDEASDFTGTDIEGSRAHGSDYSYADYVGGDGDVHLILEVVYDDYLLPPTVPAASSGDSATILVESDGDTRPVPGASADGALLNFTVECVRVRVSAIGFSPTDEDTAQLRNLLEERARTAAQGSPPAC